MRSAGAMAAVRPPPARAASLRPLATAAAGASKEARLRALLSEQLSPTELDVVDVSGGCGASFRVRIVSPQFAGKNMLAQHRAVNAVLKDELADVHALQLDTAAPKKQ